MEVLGVPLAKTKRVRFDSKSEGTGSTFQPGDFEAAVNALEDRGLVANDVVMSSLPSGLSPPATPELLEMRRRDKSQFRSNSAERNSLEDQLAAFQRLVTVPSVSPAEDRTLSVGENSMPVNKIGGQEVELEESDGSHVGLGCGQDFGVGFDYESLPSTLKFNCTFLLLPSCCFTFLSSSCVAL